MKRCLILPLSLMLLILVSCVEIDTFTEPDLEPCASTFTMTYLDIIPINDIEITHSETRGNLNNFIHPCKPADTNPLLFTKSSIRTHQVIFSFDAIYPLDAILWTSYIGDLAETIPSLSIDASINGLNFNRVIRDFSIEDEETTIPMAGVSAKSVRITFQAGDITYGLQDIKFILGMGHIVIEDTQWTSQFLRYEGWTGADGIFSFNLNGDRSIGASTEHTAFIFSDTFVGDVSENNNLRGQFKMINNSLGYFDHQAVFENAFRFDYLMQDGVADSIFSPDAYIGKRARNLLDGDGLTWTHTKDATLTNVDDGIMWLSEDPNATLEIDFHEPVDASHLVIWNYNSIPAYGAKDIRISYSLDGINYTHLKDEELPMATGTPEESYSLEIDIDRTFRYLKLDMLTSYDVTFVGLGKIMLFDPNGHTLFGRITASSEITTPTQQELSARLWLQDGIVIDDKLYVLPILVKDFENFFKVHSVGLLEIPISNNELDHERTEYHDTPLQIRTEDGGEMFFGAGILDQTSQDGFIYIYGYKDLSGRHLTVARTTKENFTDFNQWTFFDGVNFQSDPTQSHMGITGVSPELSVTYIPSGIYAGKYMLVSIENSISSRVVYALSDTPYGPFEPFTLLYQAIEGTYLNGAFAYNAKMHPHLSEPGNYLISYNVNTTNLGALRDARIYYPRFIRMIEVKT